MGARANSVVKDLGRVLVRFHENGADELVEALGAGEDAARAWVARGRVEAALLNAAWAEGGVLIDDGERRLWLWTDAIPPGERGAALEVVRAAWPRWDVEWCRHGALSLARAAGLPQDGILGEGLELARWTGFRPQALEDEAGPWRTVVRIRDAVVEELVVRGFACLHLAAFGERVAEVVRERVRTQDALVVRGETGRRAERHEVVGLVRGDETWDGGVLEIDAGRRTVTVVYHDPVTHDPRLAKWLARRWAGWTVAVNP